LIDPNTNSATLIEPDDVVKSVADALQHISCYHSLDFVRAMHLAYEREQSPAAKDAIAQILINSRLCAEDRRPVCQDTGIVVAFIEMGLDVRLSSTDRTLEELVNEGVRQAYNDNENPLRASMVSDPIGRRLNTGDNTPAVTHTRLVKGSEMRIALAAKGGGSENKACLAMLLPGADIVEWVVNKVSQLGAGWCPPGVLGVGIGGTAEKATLLAKEALLQPIDIQDLIDRGPRSSLDELRLTLYERINGLGIGAQGLGGLTTVLDVKVLDYPTHTASLPVALIPNCAATRHVSFKLDGSGSAKFLQPQLNDWPVLKGRSNNQALKVDLDSLTPDEVKKWKSGDRLLLSGRLITARDAAHQRLVEMARKDEPLPPGLDLAGRFIYYTGPVEAVGNEVVGPAGPTTALRMDGFTETMLENYGILGMIGKGERSEDTVEIIRKYQAVYLIAVGGAAYLVSKAIRAARVLAFDELGIEAIREFVVEDMPVTVAVDVDGSSIHRNGPRKWQVLKFRRPSGNDDQSHDKGKN